MTTKTEKETELLKEALGAYAGKELEMLDQEKRNRDERTDVPGTDAEGTDVRKAGARLDAKIKRTFWYYGGGRKKLTAAAGIGVSLAAALLLGFGIRGMQAERGDGVDSARNGLWAQHTDLTLTDASVPDEDDRRKEVYVNYYGEEAALPGAGTMSQNVTDRGIPEELSTLPFSQWNELGIGTDAAQAVRNSNYKSYGYLCTDGNGMIYFSDMQERAIYAGNEDGSGRVKLAEGAGNYLQENGGNLYYTALDEDGVIMRLNIASMEKTVLFDKPHGEFVLTDEGILINAESGVLLLNYDGSEARKIEAMPNTDWQPALFTLSDDYILFNAVQADNAGYYMQGYLLGYDRKKQEVSYLGRSMLRPLIAGNYLLAISGDSLKESSLHVIDMASGADTDLGVWPYDGFVSDGEAVYYTRAAVLYRFRDGVSEELVSLAEYEGETAKLSPNRYLYLAGDCLYWMTQVQVMENGEVKETLYEWHSINLPK